ncbi:HD-GYP domain-containing protein [Deinococcus sp.]|uniref:HD-GYP domain-containing protein n=1 Tax=Deinococcus sp. TaxID=47478 RepID=UPI0025F3220A|nr:HD-GYP domain-containing protein [Deinococcus sp.]
MLLILATLVTAGLVAYGVVARNTTLVIGMTVLCAAFSQRLSGVWRWIPILAYAAAFSVQLAVFKVPPAPLTLLGALLLLLGLGLMFIWEGTKSRETVWLKNTVSALEEGSVKLGEARDAEAIIRAGIVILQNLRVAPHFALVAYRRGTPMILAARGAFENFIEQPIVPGDNDSRSVQADHWVAEEVLSLLPRTQRKTQLVVNIYGRATQHLGLILLTREDREFRIDEKSVVESFARLFGAQLGQVYAIRELRDANDLTLKALGAALEHRDDETGGHTQRVVTLSLRLAARLGWDEERLKAARWGAYLHDLGKIAVPDAILHKPGPLDPQERTSMQRHATIGYDMLQDLHFLPAETLDLVRYHHERWDGGGYPSGLRGQDIPDTARLFSIIDVYDALVNARPYKPAWSRERALQELRKQSGSQFDPQFVDAFLRMMSEQDDAKLVR